MKGTRTTSAKGDVSLQVGQSFNPFGLFNGVFVPECLSRCCWLSGGAKLAWGRLARYAGRDGRCYPTMKALGEEIGVRERQAQKYVAELERHEMVRSISRYVGRAQTSNGFEFLWHQLFEQGVNDRSGGRLNDHSGDGVNDRSPKESHFQESQTEATTIDLDYPAPNRKDRNSRLDVRVESSKQYPRLREALADYMTTADDLEQVYPSDRHVVDVMDAADASEEEVIRCLRYLRDERGLRPRTKHGPRHFSWFKTVVAEYFQRKRDREAIINPTGVRKNQGNVYGLSKEVFDSMTEALE
jgi:hypothetical protein